jgi:hypothetical protein
MEIILRSKLFGWKMGKCPGFDTVFYFFSNILAISKDKLGLG